MDRKEIKKKVIKERENYSKKKYNRGNRKG